MGTELATELKAERNAQAVPPPGTELAITGMTCGNCARHVTEAIQSVRGVRSATVRLEANQASVRWTAGAEPSIAAVIQAVQDAGYGASVADKHAPESSERKLGAGHQLKVGRSNMDTLVALGSTTAFAYSAWALFSGLGGHVYFMEAAAIITLVSLGHWIESRVSARASSALRQLLDLAPALARRRDPAGAETEVPVAELRTGDRVILRPGDRVPTDGEVV